MRAAKLHQPWLAWWSLTPALMLLLVAGLSACGGSKVSSLGAGSPSSHSVKTIALDPSGGLLADAVGVELAAKGYIVIDASQTSRLAMRIGLDEGEIMLPRGLEALATQGVDAVLIVRSEAGYDRLPQSAIARLTSTNDGLLLSGVTWQNGWGGQAGSVADRQMRKDLHEAAIEIAQALPSPAKPTSPSR